jgi:adenylate cyclase
MNLRPNLAFTPPAVRAQLAAILASEAFVRSRRMQRFLEFVVEETLAGRDGQLGEYGIGLAVFDRSPDFEPALDPIVRK